MILLLLSDLGWITSLNMNRNFWLKEVWVLPCLG